MAEATSATDLLAALIAAPWVADLVKIGIPSIITLVSIVVTARTTTAGQQKDLAIEALRQQADESRVVRDHRSALVKDVAARVVAVESAIGEHSGVYRAGYEPGDENPALQLRHSEALQNLEKAVQQCMGVQALVHLLADDELADQIESYLEALHQYQVAANPEDEQGEPVDELYKLHETIVGHRVTLMRGLGKIYPGAPRA
ncbi:hypothetical protein [Burkholderia aenigmatica]|uniref:Uncharacterized protein n=1 Tax=Burkholderia aenigmatica TaxID=2015348 RepID=A0A228IIC1_9BURK|nr:hypothetical protein [Burkholderia aenigmatica]OXI42151.1 hypothetical protein CFB84_23220 [Burkholderia aenigmatica]